MAEGWRMWVVSLLTILLLLPLLSAAPLNIAGDIKEHNDGMHSHDENVTRGGKFFGHNQFDIRNINISGSVAGDVVSIGHKVKIDDHHHHEADTVECKEGIRVLFKSIDSNKNGLMDAKELLRVCHQNNFQITESSAVRILTLPDKSVGFNMAKFCELLKDCQSTNSVDIIYFLLQLYDKGCVEKFDYDTDYKGGDVSDGANVKSNDKEDCRNMCRDKTGCNFWTFVKSWSNNCLLKHSSEGKEPHSGYVSGNVCKGTPLKKWIGGFPESNPAFAYPSPNLAHFENGSVLPLLDNMDNIDKLDLQLGVKWPEFSWETEPGKPESRTFAMFAPYISRLGYTVEGRVFSIICPQIGASSPTLGSLNIEVTVTGQRGWVNQPKRTMAADMTVVGKIWFGPGAKENWLVRLLWHLFERSSLPFPHSKKNAIIVNTHSGSFTDQSFFSLRHGESTEFEIPEFAKHPEAWSVGNLRVQIGQIKKTGSEVVDAFNQLILDIFNAANGNMLKEKNTLYWNVWFTEPHNVNRTEWRNHAEKWRDSIDTGHGSPYGDGTYPKYFNGTLFNPFKEVSPEKMIENELEKILQWLKKYINILNK